MQLQELGKHWLMTHLSDPLKLSYFPVGFEENDKLRSDFVRRFTLDQIARNLTENKWRDTTIVSEIPRTLIRYWHDADDVPDDVRVCLDSWETLRDENFEILTFNDLSAAEYIKLRFSKRECAAFDCCHHPAMRSDYFRMCYILADGGFYVDADDVMVGILLQELYVDNKLRLQPLCYDIESGTMVPTLQIWQANLQTDGRIFYVNNNPLIAPAGHAVVHRALERATNLLLENDSPHEIQSTTGPGNLSAALVAHVRDCELIGKSCEVELMENWDNFAETRWELSYRADNRNWRNLDRC